MTIIILTVDGKQYIESGTNALAAIDKLKRQGVDVWSAKDIKILHED